MKDWKVLTVAESEPFLRTPSRTITALTETLEDLGSWMVRRLDREDIKGLAAVQFGVQQRMIVFRYDTLTVRVLLNPTVVKVKGEQPSFESCLSIPGFTYRVIRPATLKVRGLSWTGEELTIRAHGQLACVLAHEIQHLNGVLLDKVGEIVIS